MFEWVEVPDSSTVQRFGYDAETQTLRVEFQNGTYAYSGITEEIFNEMKAASSKGKFVAQNLKGIYQATKV